MSVSGALIPQTASERRRNEVREAQRKLASRGRGEEESRKRMRMCKVMEGRKRELEREGDL